ncbi:MAG: hypothetical protein JSR55_09585 [Proteobacteria bacterium]|nr:hypothetical protein [Pseudomonadota bacterium]
MLGDRHTLLRIAAAVLFTALSACSTTPATPPDNSAARAANAAYFTGDFNCTKADAAQVDLKLLNAATMAYLEKCIRFEAFTDGSALYVNAAHMKPIKASAVGLYWKDDEVVRRLKLGPSFVVITGRLRDCARHNAMTVQAAALQTAPSAVPAAPAIIGACKTAATAIFISEAEIVPTAMD